MIDNEFMRQSWEEASDEEVVRAWLAGDSDYKPEAREIIHDELEKRRLWEEVQHLKSEMQKRTEGKEPRHIKLQKTSRFVRWILLSLLGLACFGASLYLLHLGSVRDFFSMVKETGNYIKDRISESAEEKEVVVTANDAEKIGTGLFGSLIAGLISIGALVGVVAGPVLFSAGLLKAFFGKRESEP